MTQTLYTPPSIETRLAMLPRKTAEPFRQLLAAGQLSEEVISIVLDAGEQSGDTNRLIAFAAGYFGMRLKNVPVHDVIALARKNQRRINLAWSPARWKDEHDKLSRLEALKRLAEDLRRFRLHPAPALIFPRLHHPLKPQARYGRPPPAPLRRDLPRQAQGRHQRHSCHADQWPAFHNRRQLTGTPETPLRIAQIRTRFNELPDETIRAQIHDLLGIPLPSAARSDNPVHENPHHYMDNLRAVLPVLRRHGITDATVSFNGGGDDGAIEEVDLTPADNADAILNEPVTIIQRTSVLDDGNWINQARPVDCTLADAITAITDDYLEFTLIDWYNDSGGFGQLEINVEAGTVSLEVSTRYEEWTTEYSAEHDIATDTEL